MANLFSKSNKNYVSEVTVFLKEFDKKHPELSASQQAEIKKYERINKLRDHAVEQNSNSFLPKDF